MKSKCILFNKIIVRDYFFSCKPAFFRKGVLKLIPVQKYLGRANNRIYFPDIGFTYPCQVILYLLRLVVKLKMIRQMLPPAAPAYAEMPATGLYPVGRVFMETDHTAFHVFFPLLIDLDINYITRYQHRYKNNLIINSCNSISFGTNIRYSYFFEKGKFIFPS